MAGLGTACPSAAYDDVIESITDWAFSSPISTGSQLASTSTRPKTA